VTIIEGFGFVIGFIGLLKHVNAINYSAISNPIQHAQFSQSALFTGRRLVTAFNAVGSSASEFSPLLTGDMSEISIF
jgi:hypothetical protein